MPNDTDIERAATLRWIRDCAVLGRRTGTQNGTRIAGAYDDLAASIERGDHVSPIRPPLPVEATA